MRRPREAFRPLEDSARQDRAAFLDAATDIPSGMSPWPIPVTRAGVRAQAIAFSLPSFTELNEPIAVAGSVDAWARLGAAQRGVHMSRIVAAIDSVSGREWPSTRDLLEELVALVAKLQDQPVADVELTATALAHRQTRVTGRRSPDRFRIHGEARIVDGVSASRIGLGATVITACPCTQAFSTYSMVLDLADEYGIEHANDVGGQLLGYTHSQRGELTVWVDAAEHVDLPVLYEAMETSAHLVYELLKRPDEHELVRRAHERPQFTEDVVRSVAAQLGDRLRTKLSSDKLVTVECRNIESIHSHDAHAVVEATVGDLAACFDAAGGVPQSTS